MFKKHDREMIHFSGRRHTKTGIISTIIGAVNILGFVAISIISGVAKGNGGLILGVAGLLILALSILGFVLSYKAFLKKDVFYRFPLIGGILNGFMTVVLLIIYIFGLV